MTKLIFLKIIKYTGLLILIFGLTGCGFKLRGNYYLSENFKNLVVIYHGNKEHPFYDQFRIEFNRLGVKLINEQNLTAIKAEHSDLKILELTIPLVQESINSYDSANQISGNIVSATCNYKILDLEHKVLRERGITKFYRYSLDSNKLLANASERQEIIRQLNMDLILELIEQLSLFK